MSDLSDLPEGWTVWHEEPDGRVILVFRPDVFDSQAFPAPCLPTLYVTRGPRQRRRPAAELDRSTFDTWHVSLFLEPEVERPGTREYDTREAALAAGVDLAERFAAGEIDPREVYQVPRERYLDKLEELTGRDP